MRLRFPYSRIELSCRIAYVIELVISWFDGTLLPGDAIGRNAVLCTMLCTFALFVYVRRRSGKYDAKEHDAEAP